MRFLDMGDTAFTIEFGDRIDPDLQAAVNALDVAVARERRAGRLEGIIETVPTFRSLTVIHDPLTSTRAELIDAVQALADAAGNAPAGDGRHWCLPACYGEDFGPDLMNTAEAIGEAPETVIKLHSDTEYVVYMLGFLPGFPFMGDLPETLHRPRRTEPRVRVPAGSVAIANGLTAIYPWESPGGWHLLARCPVPLFDATRDQPALLASGDRVRFEPVAARDMKTLQADLAAGRIDPRRWCTPP